MTTVEQRLTELEERIREMEARLRTPNASPPAQKRGWRAFVGVFADNPRFEEAARFGREWRSADSPSEDR